MMELEGRNVLITGGGRGIGQACAIRAAKSGANVSILGRTQKQLEEVVSRLKADFPRQKFFSFAGDVSHESDVIRWVAESERALGPATDLINNAADFFSAKLIDTSLSEWERLFAVNVHGVFLCSRECVKKMLANKTAGSIVNIGSLAGIRGLTKFAGTTAYCATKSALVSMTEAMAAELRELNIRVNLVAPGAVETEMLHRAFPGFHSPARPEDLAEVVIYFLNPKAARVVTGSVLEVLTTP